MDGNDRAYVDAIAPLPRLICSAARCLEGRGGFAGWDGHCSSAIFMGLRPSKRPTPWQGRSPPGWAQLKDVGPLSLGTGHLCIDPCGMKLSYALVQRSRVFRGVEGPFAHKLVVLCSV